MTDVIKSVKGTRDFYPLEKGILTWLYTNIREVSEQFGYQEYEGPYLETIDLYAAKSGEELVKEQSFVFEDRGGNPITLRPELTPSLVRMVAQRQHQLVFPLRWWSFGPFWRYERPQKGRSREFFQWNIDLIGVGTPEVDAELTAVIATFFKKIGLTPQDVSILVNNRRLMDEELNTLGISLNQRPEVYRLIDRKAKLSASAWEKYGQELGLNSSQISGLKNILKNANLWEKSEELQRFFQSLQVFGVSEFVRYAPEVIRGLDYYTGTVFEAYDRKGIVPRSILGGGRYDNLMADVGGETLPGVGFAMGDMVIMLVLDKLGLIPEDLGLTPAPIFVTVFDQEHLLDSFRLASEIRQSGLYVSCYPKEEKLTKQFRYADRIGARAALVLGPDEIQGGLVTIKDLLTRDQFTIPRVDVIKAIKDLLARKIPS
jgi:histidyl-tRNA synthetase